MSKRERPGYVSLNIEVPIEVALWFAANSERIGQLAMIEASKALRNDEEHQQSRKERFEARQKELVRIGRHGYRLFRKLGGKRNLAKQRDLIKEVAEQTGYSLGVLDLAVRQFKKKFEKKLKERRNREITRLYLGGLSDQEIADRLGIGRTGVSRYVNTHKKEIRAYSQAHPECFKALIGKEKGVSLGASQGDTQAPSQEAMKKAGGRGK